MPKLRHVHRGAQRDRAIWAVHCRQLRLILCLLRRFHLLQDFFPLVPLAWPQVECPRVFPLRGLWAAEEWFVQEG